MPSTSPEPPGGALLTLTVQARPQEAVISVVDSQWRTCAKAIGHLEARLPPGIYKVVAEVAGAKWDQLVVLREPAEVTVPPLGRQLAVPLRFLAGAATTRSHETHYDLMWQARTGVPIRAGKGARVFLMARAWTSCSTRTAETASLDTTVN